MFGCLASEKTRWTSINRASLAVTALSQRNSGLWVLPTSPKELSLTFASPSSAEHEIRSGEKLDAAESFGSESITVTWLALIALRGTLGRPPSFLVQSALTRLQKICKNGAFGSVLPGIKDGLRINESARHTAMALLTRLDFSDESDPDARIRLLAPTADWLIRTRSKNGWPYEVKNPDIDEPQTTAACLCALSCFLAEIERSCSAARSDEFGSKIRPALLAGFDGLLGLRRGDFWEGIYPDTEVADNAFIFGLLSVGAKKGRLGHYVPSLTAELSDLRTRLAHRALTNGWPAFFSDIVPSLAATISVLLVMDDFLRTNEKRELRDLRERAKSFIANELLGKGETSQLKTWDWVMLARLAPNYANPLSESERNSVIAQIKTMRENAANGTLTRQVLIGIPKIAHAAIWHSLTRGQRLVDRGFWQACLTQLRGHLTSVVRWVAGTIAAALAVLFRDQIVDSLKAIFRMLFSAH
jgi:hypothetical protein